MKLPPNNGFNDRDIQTSNSTESSLSSMASQVGKIIFCAICTGMFLSGDGDRLESTIASVSPQKLVNDVDRVASNISIRILDRDFLGSGFIVQRSDREYIAVTNQHVLRAGEAPYIVETVDGQTYEAEVITDMDTSEYQYDLAILKFQADLIYETATIGSSYRLEVGEPVFAAGFPYEESNQSSTAAKSVKANSAVADQSQPNSPRKLALKTGRVAIILERALEEGYQIGYTNDVRKGMSGGPLLNLQGEAIGVNGKHAYPLWESPEIYQDGSQPCPALQELITRSSLAIPIEKSIKLATELKSLAPAVNLGYSPKSNLADEDSPLITKMQIEAEETQRICREYDRPVPEPRNSLEDIFEAP
ncbi:MAG: serine protease [Cyanobacteria bacterium J06600_6]